VILNGEEIRRKKLRSAPRFIKKAGARDQSAGRIPWDRGFLV